MNSVSLIGRITRNLEIRKTNNEKSVCEFTIAINRIGQEQADFINCTVWGKQAENLYQYKGKGDLISVEGSIRVDKYQNQEGENRYRTYVLANNIGYLTSKSKDNDEPNNEPNNEPIPSDNNSSYVVSDDDELPF